MKIDPNSRRDRLCKAAELYLEVAGFDKAVMTGDAVVADDNGFTLLLSFSGRRKPVQEEIPQEVYVPTSESVKAAAEMAADLDATEAFLRGPVPAPRVA